MIPATLTERLLIPSGFLYAARMPPIRALIPRTDYRSELITGANVLTLQATQPWLALQNHPPSLTFDRHLHRRANTPLWRIAVSYAGLGADHLQAYCESTHYLGITKEICISDLDLLQYHRDRRPSWRSLVQTACGVSPDDADPFDLLLNPYFLHLPTTQDRVRWYLGSVNDPCRNHFRDQPADHLSLQIPHLVNKFNPPAAPTPP
ncbi:hypothetical protein PHMEG_00025158 [Phytophthora megakarya]|uniref:Uncharacterized protein n=1 Tax=Phytophthora megakarya TaxID=4795 RepID=A0A225VEC1_9STRA|nr:hypothetical protein PHMEG_00025158 [Phytophthora megakarya]